MTKRLFLIPLAVFFMASPAFARGNSPAFRSSTYLQRAFTVGVVAARICLEGQLSERMLDTIVSETMTDEGVDPDLANDSRIWNAARRIQPYLSKDCEVIPENKEAMGRVASPFIKL